MTDDEPPRVIIVSTTDDRFERERGRSVDVSIQVGSNGTSHTTLTRGEAYRLVGALVSYLNGTD